MIANPPPGTEGFCPWLVAQQPCARAAPTVVPHPSMEIDLLKKHWEAFGREDPLWAILTDASRRGGRWDLDEFLAHGEDDVSRYLAELDHLGVTVDRGRALDFGCGVGRLTQALAERFQECDGVDIAAPMIEEARRINRHGERCRYHVNDVVNLKLFGSSRFDFVLSFIVLQHMEPRYAKTYIGEFLRVLRPGGIALFQVPVPSPPSPLPDGAWRADIALEDDVPRELVADEPRTLRVRVRNVGTAPWPAGSRVRLGNHWADRRGRPLAVDDGRSEMPGEVPPGQEVMLPLDVTAPAVAGRATLELDLVQEQVGWFATRGSRPVRVPVTITGGSGPVSRAGQSFTPLMEMYSVPRDEVIATVQAMGGEVLYALPDQSAGAGLSSFRYVVRRTSSVDRPMARESLEHLDAAVTTIPDRPDMLPPLLSRRDGSAQQLDLALKRTLGRALRWFTWAQVEHDRGVARALAATRSALAEHEAELRALRAELAELRRQDAGEPPAG